MKRTISSIFMACLGGAAALTGSFYINKLHSEDTGKTALIQRGKDPLIHLTGNNAGTINALNNDFTYAAEKSLNAVVHIKTQSEQNNLVYDPFAQFFGGAPRQETLIQQASGSGVVISSDGYIVTNNHVIAGANKIEVILNDKRDYIAEVVGADPSTDIALIKIKEKDLPFLNYGNSDAVKVGEWVLAVGNPFNLNSTVTAGIISAKGRNNIIDGRKNPIESFLQTDAAVNPGNSGGALVNSNGELIGINTAIASNNGAYQGYSFAVPVNIVKKVVSDLAEFGTVQRAYIGVGIRDIDAKFANENNIKQLKGAFVTNLTNGGSAEEAGVEVGDIITKIQDVTVSSVSELHEQIAKYRPGDKINVSLIRNNKEVNLSLVLKSLENTTRLVKKAEVIKTNLKNLGVTLEEASNDELANLRTPNGVKVSSVTPNGKLASAGIKSGFIIISINKKKVVSVKEVEETLNNLTGGVLIEGVYPNGVRAYYGFGM